jgi:hypothetical protein
MVLPAFYGSGLISPGIREPLNKSMAPLSFRRIQAQGVLSKACWLHVEEGERKAWVRLKDPEGAA